MVYTDTVGYSRLTGLDDAGMLDRLRTLRNDLIDPAIVEHHGRLVQTGGDSLLTVFDSIDVAVRCAVKVQQQVPIPDGDQTPDRTIRCRIGINLGVTIANGTDLHGDAVNVVARLEAECPPGGVASVWDIYIWPLASIIRISRSNSAPGYGVTTHGVGDYETALTTTDAGSPFDGRDRLPPVTILKY